MAQRPTVYDIAKRLGISPATVSRTLSGSRLVSEDMRVRVRRAAEDLGYSPRRIRRPAGRSILNIALFLPVTSARYAQLFYDVRELVAGVEVGLGGVRANIIVDLVGNTGLFEQKKIGDLHGCLFSFCRPDTESAASIDERGIPVALINRVDDSRTCIVPDNEGGMAALVDRLASEGHVRLCYLGFRGAREVSEARHRGFERALESANHEQCSGATLEVSDIEEITPRLVESIRRDGHTACMCFNDVLAMRFFDAARSAGLTIPADLSLTGFDNSPILDLSSTRIDTVSLSTFELGREAAEWITTAILERTTGIVHTRIPVQCIPGDTVAAPNSRRKG